MSESLKGFLRQGAPLGPEQSSKGGGDGPEGPVVGGVGAVKYWSARCLLVFLAACYLIQIFTPLRLNNDAITLLSMAESAARGTGFLDEGNRTVFPPGYPLILAVLLRKGLAHPGVIVALNMLFLSLGLASCRSLLVREFFEDRSLVLLICSFFLLSYTVIKHSTIPLADVPFFCLSMGAVGLMSKARSMDSGWRLWVALGTAALLALAALTVRTIGAALFPALVFTVAGGTRCVSWIRSLSLRTKVVVGVSGALVGGLAAFMLAATPYWRFFAGGQRVSIRALVLRTLLIRLIGLGEVSCNFPWSRLSPQLQAVLPWVGFALLALVVTGLVAKRRIIGPVEVYFVCYMGVLVVWPYNDSRYLLPVMPLLIGYVVLGARRLRLPRMVSLVYCIYYSVLGFGVIVYSTRITFAGCKFPERYGDGSLKQTYCTFQSCGDCSDRDKVNVKALRLLQEYR